MLFNAIRQAGTADEARTPVKNPGSPPLPSLNIL
jgi:hypothetical protein